MGEITTLFKNEPESYLDLLPDVFGVMLFPDDETKAGEFVEAFKWNVISETLSEADMADVAEIIKPAFLIGAALGAQKYGPLIDIGARPKRLRNSNKAAGAPKCDVFPGEFAAAMLLLPLAGFAQGNRIGRRAVFRAYAADGKSASVRTLQRIWKQYAPVAHFWAAFLLADGIGKSEESMIDFLSLAESLRRFAVTYRPERASGPLINSGSWCISPDSIQQMEFSLAKLGISKRVLKVLGLREPVQTVVFNSKSVRLTSD